MLTSNAERKYNATHIGNVWDPYPEATSRNPCLQKRPIVHSRKLCLEKPYKLRNRNPHILYISPTPGCQERQYCSNTSSLLSNSRCIHVEWEAGIYLCNTCKTIADSTFT